MPRNASGTVTLPTNDSNPAAPRNVIRSSDFNELMTDITTELTDSWSRSGKGKAIANLDMDTFSFLNVAAFTDGASYSMRYVTEREVNLLMFAPSLTSGADVSTAMQRMMTAAAATGKPARIPAHPSGFKWRIATGINIAGCEVVCDKGATIETVANIDMFTFTAHTVTWEGGEIEHHGNGMVFNTGLFDNHVIRKVAIDADSAAATSPLILMRGSNVYIEQPDITNSRTGAYAIVVRKVAGTLNINSRIDEPYMGGTGKGILVESEEAVERVEGLSIIGAKCILTGSEQLTVKSVLELIVSDGLWDLGSGSCILFEPAGSGVDGVSIDNNWISTGSNQTGVSGGVAVKSLTGSADVANLQIINNRIRYSAYGIALTDNVRRVEIAKNVFTDIDQTDIGGPADDWEIDGNTHSDADFGLSITEGAGGGAIQIRNEKFSAASAISLTIATRSRWVFGDTTGKKLRNKASATTAASPASPSYLLVPHGLIAAPRLSHIFLQGSFASGAYTEINVNVAAVDATNVTVQIHHTQVIGGTITVAMDCEI